MRVVAIIASIQVLVAGAATFLGGCGDAAAPSQGPTKPAATSVVATPAGANDIVVAQVNGRPVYGSCVAAQAKRAGSAAADARTRALDECIAFELLAQEADKRGLASAPEALDAMRTALVNRVVEVVFEATHRRPTDLGPRLDTWLANNGWRMNRPDLRASTYVRIPVPENNAPPDLEPKARALAENIHAALANESGLSSAHLVDTANRLAEGTNLTLEHADSKQGPRSVLDKNYGDALFAITEVGRVSSAIRTAWGWDVVLWTGGLPPKISTREELAEEVFPELRRAAFSAWILQLTRQLGVVVEIDADQLQRLEQVGS